MSGIQNLTRARAQALVQPAQELADGSAISAQVASVFAGLRTEIDAGLSILVEPDGLDVEPALAAYGADDNRSNAAVLSTIV